MEAGNVYDPARFRRVYVDSDALLREVAGEMASDDPLGVDAEMGQRVQRRPGGLQDWVHILALIQIAGQEISAVIDTVRCRDLSPLRPLLAGPARKVFLGGGQDVTLLEKEGFPVRNVVDVGEVALGIFGRREDGMAALAHRIFGISLDKSVRRADWLARPLNGALITYAHRDAELTRLIYYWFRDQYPEALQTHERLELEPELAKSTASWLQDAIKRSSSDPLVAVMEHGFVPERDREKLAADLRLALERAVAPRQINRLLRVAGEVGARDVLPIALTYLDSPSSLLRAAAARAIGQLAEPDEGKELLARLKDDPVEDVKKAVEAAKRDLAAGKKAPEAPTAEEPEQEGLPDDVRERLRQLMDSMGGE